MNGVIPLVYLLDLVSCWDCPLYVRWCVGSIEEKSGWYCDIDDPDGN